MEYFLYNPDLSLRDYHMSGPLKEEFGEVDSTTTHAAAETLMRS